MIIPGLRGDKKTWVISSVALLMKNMDMGGYFLFVVFYYLMTQLGNSSLNALNRSTDRQPTWNLNITWQD